MEQQIDFTFSRPAVVLIQSLSTLTNLIVGPSCISIINRSASHSKLFFKFIATYDFHPLLGAWVEQLGTELKIYRHQKMI
jgi:hypothetical protein